VFIGGILFFLFSTIKTSRSDISGLKLKEESSLVRIEDVPNNSPAQRMGFKKGDTLLTANNLPITEKKVLDDVLKKTGEENSFTYTIIRKGDTLTKTAPYITNYSSRFNQVVFFGENFKWFLLGFIILI
jgi:S1-C subfamily serine protease